MTRGVLMYAHNNTEIDYFKIACANALMIQRNLGVPITVVTDETTLTWAKSSLGIELIDKCFDRIVEVDKNRKFVNSRNFSDTSYNSKSLQFYNCSHWAAYELSPYDETLFIDCDYLIMSSALNNCWDNASDVMINHSIYSPLDITTPYSKSVDDISIRLCWATVIYFKKSSLAEYLFSIVKHVEENYNYYRELYSITSTMFRNDNAFSIAVHTLNGYSKDEYAIHELPIPGLLMSWDVNDILSVNGINDVTLLVEKSGGSGEYILSRIKDTDIHIMNKWSITRVAEQLINLYKDEVCHADI